jgi:sugar phosphate isomerase/epimerase
MLFGAMNFPVAPVPEEIETFAHLGFDYLELTMDPPQAHHQQLHAQRQTIVSLLQHHQLGLLCHLPTFLSTADLAPAIRRASLQEMLDSLEVAATLGAKKVVLHPSMIVGMGAYVVEKAKEYFLEFLAKMVVAARALDITICLENMMPRNILGVDPVFFDEIFSQFPLLKLTLDTGHANIGDDERMRLNTFLKRHGNRLGHVHISDNHGLRDDHIQVGGGIIDFVGFIHDLQAIGYNDTLTLEVFSDDRQMLLDSRERIQSLLKAV